MIDKKIWAVGGGKGGVGKTFVSANLAIALTRMGKRVVLVDADLGGSNLHIVLGIRASKYTLNDFLRLHIPIEEVIQDVGIDNLKLISGASAILGLANPKYVQKIKIINHLARLDTDYILLDLGAGTSYNVLDFFSVADERVVVVSPEPTSIQNCYGFIKSALFRRLTRAYIRNSLVCKLLQELSKPKSIRNIECMGELINRLEGQNGNLKQGFCRHLDNFRPRIIINMLTSQEEQESVAAVKMVSEKYLNIKVDFVGAVYNDPLIRKSVKTMTPLLIQDPYSATAQEVENIAAKLLTLEAERNQTQIVC
jgi:flagellar biosynthesis protein FlhG